MKRTLLFLLLSMLLNAKDNAFEVYADGIYDAYIQINRDVQAGIDERYMQEYKGRYIVAVPVDDVSTVKIIFYKTIGAKNSLTPVVVTHVGTGKSLLVFDTFDRKANARALKRKLLDYGLESIAIYAPAKEDSYKRNPVIINKLIKDLRNAIKDTTVRVVRVEGDSYASLPPIRESTHKKSVKRARSPQKKTACGIGTKTVDDFVKLRSRYCKVGFVLKKKLIMCKKSYSIDEYIDGFKLTAIKRENGEYVAILLGDDGQYFKLRDSWCKNPKSPCGQIAKTGTKQEAKVAQKAERKKKEGIASEKSYYCNFSIIPIIKNASGKTQRTKETVYGRRKNVKITIYEENSKELKVRGMGEDYVYISKKYFDKACDKK